MNIRGKIVTLRALTLEDQEMVCELFNDPVIEQAVVGWAFPLSLDQQLDYFKTHLHETTSRHFAIETPEDGALGVMVLSEIDWKNRSATVGIKTLLSKRSKTLGVGIDAYFALMRYCFDELGLHRLNGCYLSMNKGSEMLGKRCGWRDEGVARSAIYKHGEWLDLVYTGILEEDYRALVAKNHYWAED